MAFIQNQSCNQPCWTLDCWFILPHFTHFLAFIFRSWFLPWDWLCSLFVTGCVLKWWLERSCFNHATAWKNNCLHIYTWHICKFSNLITLNWSYYYSINILNCTRFYVSMLRTSDTGTFDNMTILSWSLASHYYYIYFSGVKSSRGPKLSLSKKLQNEQRRPCRKNHKCSNRSFSTELRCEMASTLSLLPISSSQPLIIALIKA